MQVVARATGCEDRRRGARRRGSVRARPRPHREREAAPVAVRRCTLLALGDRPGARSSSPSSAGSSAASARPATTASTSRSRRPRPSRARADAARAGWRGRLVRVHRDALRPDPARRLQGRRPSTTERSIWGGLRTEQLADLEISRGSTMASSTTVGALGRRASSTACSTDGAERLSEFREEIEDDRAAMSERFTALQGATSSAEVANRALVRSSGSSRSSLALAVFAVAGALLFFARDRRLAARLPALERRRPARRSASARRERRARCSAR